MNYFIVFQNKTYNEEMSDEYKNLRDRVDILNKRILWFRFTYN